MTIIRVCICGSIEAKYSISTREELLKHRQDNTFLALLVFSGFKSQHTDNLFTKFCWLVVYLPDQQISDYKKHIIKLHLAVLVFKQWRGNSCCFSVFVGQWLQNGPGSLLTSLNTIVCFSIQLYKEEISYFQRFHRRLTKRWNSISVLGLRPQSTTSLGLKNKYFLSRSWRVEVWDPGMNKGLFFLKTAWEASSKTISFALRSPCSPWYSLSVLISMHT
jgi:hypothetical protein